MMIGDVHGNMKRKGPKELEAIEADNGGHTSRAHSGWDCTDQQGGSFLRPLRAMHGAYLSACTYVLC